MAFTLFTLTLTDFQTRFPHDSRIQKAGPVEFEEWLAEAEDSIEEECWGADKARRGALLICAHLCNMEVRAQSKPSRIGAATTTSTDTVTESYRTPTTGISRDQSWFSTIYGKRFTRLRNTIVETYVPLAKSTDEECCKPHSKRGLSSWRSW